MKRQVFLILIIFLIASILPITLKAEIERVVVNWNSKLCKPSCAERLGEWYKKREEIESFSINQSVGEAQLQLKPNVRLTYRIVKRPMQRVGIGLSRMSVRVSGTIKEQGKKILLISSGDGTKFQLISPITGMQPGRVPKSRAARDLSETHKQWLLEAAKQNRTVVIEGKVFLPHRPPPLTIEIQKLS